MGKEIESKCNTCTARMSTSKNLKETSTVDQKDQPPAINGIRNKNANQHLWQISY